MYLIMPERNGEWVYDPSVSMAIQVYVKDHLFLDDDIMFAYMMDPVVQIGKFQNAYEEINQPYLDKHDIKTLRRDTGGGAIYMDDKNMNFCFLFDGDNNIFGNYGRLFEPAIKGLEQLGVKNIEQKGRNDLLVDGNKISGGAMTLENGRVYAGYSLLLDPDYEAMVESLNPNQKKIQSHGIQSIRSRVGDIRSYLDSEYQSMTVWEFTDHMICAILDIDHVDKAKYYVLTEEDWAAIDKLAQEKYDNWDWTYGRFQHFEYEINERFPIGTINLGLSVMQGKISKVQITGDFFGRKEITDIESALLDVRLKKDDLLKALENFNLTDYFGDITTETFVNAILSIPEEIETK